MRGVAERRSHTRRSDCSNSLSATRFHIGNHLEVNLYKQPGNDSSPAEQERERVVSHFLRRTERWRKIYESDGLYEVIHQQRQRLVMGLACELSPPKSSRFLDVGCGAGRLAVSLAKQGYAVDAVDLVGSMLELTRKFAAESDVAHLVNTTLGDVQQLPFQGNLFSLVIAIGVTPWLGDLKRGLREIARVLQPGGYLIINADNRWRLNYILDPRLFPLFAPLRQRLRDKLERFGLPERKEPLARGYSIRDFDAFLAEAGYRKLRSTGLGFGPFSFFNHRLFSESLGIRIHQKLQAFADQKTVWLRSLGDQYVVLAKKPESSSPSAPASAMVGRPLKRRGVMT